MAPQSEGLEQMAKDFEKLMLEKQKLQEKYDNENEKNKALRHKAG